MLGRRDVVLCGVFVEMFIQTLPSFYLLHVFNNNSNNNNNSSNNNNNNNNNSNNNNNNNKSNTAIKTMLF